MTCSLFQWKLWNSSMGKTFEEWFEEVNGDGQLEDRTYYLGKWPDGDYFSYVGFEEVMKEAWEASRQHMTTRDI